MIRKPKGLLVILWELNQIISLDFKTQCLVYKLFHLKNHILLNIRYYNECTYQVPPLPKKSISFHEKEACKALCKVAKGIFMKNEYVYLLKLSFNKPTQNHIFIWSKGDYTSITLWGHSHLRDSFPLPIHICLKNSRK